MRYAPSRSPNRCRPCGHETRFDSSSTRASTSFCTIRCHVTHARRSRIKWSGTHSDTKIESCCHASCLVSGDGHTRTHTQLVRILVIAGGIRVSRAAGPKSGSNNKTHARTHIDDGVDVHRQRTTKTCHAFQIESAAPHSSHEYAGWFGLARVCVCASVCRAVDDNAQRQRIN